MPTGRFHVENVTDLKAVAEVAGGPPGFEFRQVSRRTDPFNRDPVVILMKRAVGKRIATNNRLAFPRDVQLEGNILAGLEHGQCPTVMRREVK